MNQCPFCGSVDIHITAELVEDASYYRDDRMQWDAKAFCGGCSVSVLFDSLDSRQDALDCARAAWNRRATPGGDAKPSTCCPGSLLVPFHSTDTKMCTGCKTERHWPLEPGQKRTFD